MDIARKESIKSEIVEVGRRIWQQGWVAANDGNICARLDDDRIVITPTGCSKGFMSPQDLLVVDREGRVIEGTGRPSSELHLHLSVLRDRPDCGAICHAHPVFATGFATAGMALMQKVLPEVILNLSEVPLVPYGTPGTEELYQSIAPFLRGHDAWLLANHGALTLGSDVFNAYYRMETVEHFAHVAFVALQLGRMNVLSDDQVAKLYAIKVRLANSTH